MAAHVSGGNLPQLTVFTVGEVGSGKSTLTRALVDVRGEEVPYAAALAGDTVEYTGTRYHYLHTDVPAQDVPARLKGAAPVPDGVILVVSAAEGPGPGVLEHVEAAVGAGVPAVVVFLNQCDRCDDAKAQQDLEDRIAGELGCLRPPPRGLRPGLGQTGDRGRRWPVRPAVHHPSDRGHGRSPATPARLGRCRPSEALAARTGTPLKRLVWWCGRWGVGRRTPGVPTGRWTCRAAPVPRRRGPGGRRPRRSSPRCRCTGAAAAPAG